MYPCANVTILELDWVLLSVRKSARLTELRRAPLKTFDDGM